MDSVFEAILCRSDLDLVEVSILVSVDSVFEVVYQIPDPSGISGFNPSFCGFGI